jgi:hypothetical protein
MPGNSLGKLIPRDPEASRYHEALEQRLLDVEPVLGLLPRRGSRSVQHVACDLLPAVGREAVEDDRVG